VSSSKSIFVKDVSAIQYQLKVIKIYIYKKAS